MKSYKIAPEDSRLWKCSWLNCAHGMGLAGSGNCSARGDWDIKDCEEFITEEDFIRLVKGE
jgi:hypothetical protein